MMSVAWGDGVADIARLGCFRVFVAGFQIDVEACEVQIVEFLLNAMASNPQGQELNQRQLHTSHLVR